MMLPILLAVLFLVEPCYSFPASLEYTYANCYNSSTYAVNSSFESNLNILLSSLTQQIINSKNGFLTLKQGSPTDNEPAYGLALCRGDIAHFDCHQCLLFAISHAKNMCPIRANQVIVWEEDCILRYSNQSFFSALQDKPYVSLHNRDNITNHVNDWFKVLNQTLSDVISSAATNKFGTKEGLYMNKTLYTLAQCNPDLTNQDCSECLNKANSIYDKIFIGGIVLTPSCTLRYEIYPFYNTTQPSSSSSNFTAHAPTNLAAMTNPGKKKKYVSKAVIAIVVVSIVVIGMLFAILTFCLKKKSKKYNYPLLDVKNVLDDLTTAESLMFELTTLEAATNNFSDDRKLGQGGFGSVYQGTLPNGQQIAVKRLSRTSGQGVEEFKNEVVLIAKLQHRNLVRLLGFCLAGEEKLLVYQFIPNKSLNYFIFDKEKQGKLNWPMRYNIIKGIARGLLYLHEDSRPRIIHRDLKAGNILLDAEMNPKISDFGLARIVNVEKIEDDTSRVVGTYGYMAPEYAMHGQFSVKSDVYSFGILVLEIVSGKKISGKYKAFRGGDLLTHAWSSLIEGKAIEIIDPTLKDSYSSEEVTKCIQIGLWCAQENANERPIMSTIVLMLNNDTTTTNTIPTMSCPRSFYNSSRDSSVVSRINQQSTTTTTTTTTTINDLVTFSENQDTISEVYPR